MKPIIYAIVIYLLLILLVFLAFAFVRWEINPHNWPMESRGSCMVICFLLSPFIALIAHSLNDK